MWFFSNEQEVNQIDEEEKLDVVKKEKGLALKTSSMEEEMLYTSCDDEEPKIQAKANCRRLILSGTSWIKCA